MGMFGGWRVLGLVVLVLAWATGAAQARPADDKAQKKASSAPARAAKAKAQRPRAVVKAVPRRPSVGEIRGLRASPDPLELKSSVALVVDADTNQVLVAKNTNAVLPIASITKLMTAIVVTEQQHDLSEMITVTEEDVDTEKGSRSRLKVGTRLSRGEMLHLALMSSENRAAHALGRSAPGGMAAFVAAMNDTARRLGMSDTRYVEPTGLSSQNRSSASDLAQLVKAAAAVPLIAELSTSPAAEFAVGNRAQHFRNTNGLVGNPAWEIGLQKTGYIAEAGRCLVMQAQTAGRKLIMVLLDSAGRYSRIGDAERIRRWLAQHDEANAPNAAR
ncbi:MAG: serine hydrolase [Rubrivivax sp.]|nr:serine hydrolase [Rubrivivax sp.]